VTRVIICLWYDGDAEEASQFYCRTFPNSRASRIEHAPGDYPDGRKGDVLTVEFTVLGIPCLGLNGGPQFPHTEAFSFQVGTDTQEETDRYWDAIVGNGGSEGRCGWCRDRKPLIHRAVVPRRPRDARTGTLQPRSAPSGASGDHSLAAAGVRTTLLRKRPDSQDMTESKPAPTS